MARKRKVAHDGEDARHFFHHVLRPQILSLGGAIEMRAFPNDRGSGIAGRSWITTADEYLEFISDHSGDGDNDIAVYHGVAPRPHGAGDKKSILGTTVLWCEVDVIKLGWDMTTTLQTIHSLPPGLQPSVCVESGYGLHLYWLLSEGLTDVQQIEDANAALRDMFSGDNIHNADRILRCPGSWNTKRGKKKACQIVWCYHWHRHDPDELIDAVLSSNTVLSGDRWISPEEAAEASAILAARDEVDAAESASRERRRKNARGETIWERCKYGGGPGYVGVDEAILLSTAHRYIQMWKQNRQAGVSKEGKALIVRRVLKDVRSIWARDAASSDGDWDWHAEEQAIWRKLNRWEQRWSGIVKQGRSRGKARAV